MIKRLLIPRKKYLRTGREIDRKEAVRRGRELLESRGLDVIKVVGSGKHDGEFRWVEYETAPRRSSEKGGAAASSVGGRDRR